MKNLMYMAMDLWGGVFCLVVALISACLWRKRNGQCMLVCAMAVCVAGVLFSDCVAWGFRGMEGAIIPLKVSNFLAFLFSIIVTIPFILYVYASAGCNRLGKGFYLVLGCVCFSVVIVVVTQFNGLLYYFDASNLYCRNDRWYWLISVSYFIQAASLFATIMRYRTDMEKERFLVVLLLVLLPFVAVLVQTFVYGYSLSSIAAALGIVFCFVELLYRELYMWSEQEQSVLPLAQSEGVQVRLHAFGEFQIFIGEEPVRFSYSRTKELLAILTDRRGAFCSNGMLIGLLWEDESASGKNAYLRKLRQDLFDTLARYGQKNIILHRRGEMALDMDRVQCDYYDFLAGKPSAPYMGEYMHQYRWAEETNAFLSEKSRRT